MFWYVFLWCKYVQTFYVVQIYLNICRGERRLAQLSGDCRKLSCDLSDHRLLYDLSARESRQSHLFPHGQDREEEATVASN